MFASVQRFRFSSRQKSTDQIGSKQSIDSVYENVKNLVSRDLSADRNEYFVAAPKILMDLFLSRGRQEKDATLFHCLFNVSVVCIVNSAIVLLFPNMAWQWIALLSVARISVFATPRFVLALHAASHSPLFENETFNFVLLNHFLGPFMGIPSGAYPLHHIKMHHKEDNLFPLDLSSTMPFQRDNMLHFLFYWARFAIGSWFELPYWMVHKGFYRILAGFLFNLTVYWIVVSMAWSFRPAAALWLFILPYLFVSLLLMFGNWSQHIFIDPDDFANDHSLTVNCIDSPYNQATFNDGYHIIHHKYPYLHWSKLPAKFIEKSQFESHGQANAICFRSVDWFWVGVFVMSGRLDLLATYFVPLTTEQAEMSVDDIVAFLKRRLVPVRNKKSEQSGGGYRPLFGLVTLLFGKCE